MDERLSHALHALIYIVFMNLYTRERLIAMREN